jgi:hypothetical protein
VCGEELIGAAGTNGAVATVRWRPAYRGSEALDSLPSVSPNN